MTRAAQLRRARSKDMFGESGASPAVAVAREHFVSSLTRSLGEPRLAFEVGSTKCAQAGLLYVSELSCSNYRGGGKKTELAPP